MIVILIRHFLHFNTPGLKLRSISFVNVSDMLPTGLNEEDFSAEQVNRRKTGWEAATPDE
jgi:hypothetical protein